MKISQRISSAGRIGTVVLVSIFVSVCFAVFLGIQWRPAKVVVDKQADFLAAVGSRNKAKVRKLLADDYEDRWKFDADDAAEAIVDVGGQFLTLYVMTEEQELQKDGKRIVVLADWTVEGNPLGPVGNEVLRRINRLDAPFVVKWEQQNLFPTSWKIVEIDNADLPGELYGYEPGDFRRAMEGARERLGE